MVWSQNGKDWQESSADRGKNVSERKFCKRKRRSGSCISVMCRVGKVLKEATKSVRGESDALPRLRYHE